MMKALSNVGEGRGASHPGFFGGNNAKPPAGGRNWDGACGKYAWPACDLFAAGLFVYGNRSVRKSAVTLSWRVDVCRCIYNQLLRHENRLAIPRLL